MSWLNWLVGAMIASMIFFPEAKFYEKPEDYQLQAEEVRLEVERGVELFGWFLKAPSEQGVILFLHGNAGNISGRLFKAKGWIDRGFSVFLLDYRSYGKSTGKIHHEDDLYADARAGFDWLAREKRLSPTEIILYGESIGSAPAVKLGTEEKVKAIILESPFKSFVELAAKHYPVVGPMLIKNFQFDNASRISQLLSPVFFMHGTLDEICPYESSEALFEDAPEPKSFFTIPNGRHNDLPMIAGEDYWEKPVQFVLTRRS